MLKLLPFLVFCAVGAGWALGADSPPTVPSSTEAARAARAELEQWTKAIVQEAEDTARLLRACANDQRRPSGADIGGVWEYSAGAPGMGFYLFEQKGEHITGADYMPACGGGGSTTQVTGTYRDGVLVLVHHFANGATMTDRMIFRERDHRPVFVGTDAPFQGHTFMAARTALEQPAKAPAK